MQYDFYIFECDIYHKLEVFILLLTIVYFKLHLYYNRGCYYHNRYKSNLFKIVILPLLFQNFLIYSMYLNSGLRLIELKD